MEKKRLKIAVQKEGRLTKKSLEMLAKAGLKFKRFRKNLFSPCVNFPLDIFFVRDDDIINYIQDGAVDLGIVGLNLVYEAKTDIKIMQKLGFGRCELKIAVPKKAYYINSLQNLNGKKIATSYPNSLKKFLKKEKINAKIIILKGSVEIAPFLKISDFVCDLVSTGRTLEENKLKPLCTIFKSEAVLIGNKKLKNIGINLSDNTKAVC